MGCTFFWFGSWLSILGICLAKPAQNAARFSLLVFRGERMTKVFLIGRFWRVQKKTQENRVLIRNTIFANIELFAPQAVCFGPWMFERQRRSAARFSLLFFRGDFNLLAATKLFKWKVLLELPQKL